MIANTSQLNCLKRFDSRKFQNRKRQRVKSQIKLETTKKGYVLKLIVHEYIPYSTYYLTKNTEVNYKDGHKFLPSFTCLWIIPSYSSSELGHVTCSGQRDNSKCGINRLKKCLCISASILLQFLESYKCHVKQPRKPAG